VTGRAGHVVQHLRDSVLDDFQLPEHGRDLARPGRTRDSDPGPKPASKRGRWAKAPWTCPRWTLVPRVPCLISCWPARDRQAAENQQAGNGGGRRLPC
jgi:hypothetical protein